MANGDLYQILGVAPTASHIEIRQAFRTRITRLHPDKGGDPVEYEALKQAFDVLQDEGKRKEYDTTGEIVRHPDEEFADAFGAGFKSRTKHGPVDPEPDIARSIALHVTAQPASFTAGFEAWMRSRGEQGTATVTAETMAEKFGVVHGTYASVPLPKIQVYTARCMRAGPPSEVIQLAPEALPPALEWGEVLVSMRAAPINPADLYSARTGGLYAAAKASPPFFAGQDGVGVLAKVGDGVKDLAEGDVVIPARPHFGTWRTLAVCKAQDVLKLPAGLLAMEHAALACHLCTAYRLLESCRGLQPGDAVLINAANSTMGQLLVQLCAVLRLRCLALVRDHGKHAQNEAWLRGLGAHAVFVDASFSKASLEQLGQFAKPKVALDCVGGESAGRMAAALAEDGELVVYGCASGRAPNFAWQSWVFEGLRVRGFNGRVWMAKHKAKVIETLKAMAKLISADRLRLEHTEYELSKDLPDALEHAQSHGVNSKVMLCMADVGMTY